MTNTAKNNSGIFLLNFKTPIFSHYYLFPIKSRIFNSMFLIN